MFVTFAPSGRVLLSGTTQFDPTAVQVPPASADVPVARLAFVAGAFVDLGTLTSFWIDPIGQKHPADGGPGWPKLACGWTDTIVPDGAGGWKVKT